MKLSKALLSTLRETPAEAEIQSHKFLLRAGMIRKMATGVYNFLPLGLKALKNIETIIREEMDALGSQEFLTASLVPEELYVESGRWNTLDSEILRTKDRTGKNLCLGHSDEEVFTDLARNEIKSYKQLPLNLYQVQTKYRDEKKPKLGIIRCREFIMKTACSFDKDVEGLDLSYNTMREAYHKVFHRCGLEPRCVEANSSTMGHSFSEEFMIPSEIGEDEIAFCSSCNYAANMEVASSEAEIAEKESPAPLNKVETPNVRTIDELASFFHTTPKKFAKTLIFKTDTKVIAVMVRGDREVNETKVINALADGTSFEMADADVVFQATSAEIGFAGPVGIKVDTLLVDLEVADMHNFLIGANDTGYHYENVNYGRDFTGILGDFRKVMEGDACPKCGASYKIKRGIEIGHIFKLGTKYSETMGATFLNETGENKPLVMGCYDIGITRTLSTIVETHNDENGIIWPLSVAPYKVIVIPAVTKDLEQMRIAHEIYTDLKELGIEVLLDDREERAGVKFKDADLIGIPMRITVGKKINEGIVEFKLREASDLELLSIDTIVERVKKEFSKNNLKLG